ncbi:Coenzyme F420 hydrogenase/dehydrogenase, beta subunit C-terminal domain [Stenotrophomonas sp. CFBP 13724]|uniref:Coenzyme F420 hydrogenase/dehydrogenase, beta subunit C-terminal domain n=1 Tax=Stenotrophomonas sp. CFBP 13724 TaxID=2775298 RepID=UPI001786A022|nr:Coenzyme F420 hydrogenase/dehydrogenase, beta subunit C-terminal domain [Stenotrophomonas sp. CFBP 13724]MBD8645104.1 Coenzyme F420 hydrogenase/dehydrogenase, beta subunit C-terminal domain [Stenotrophomonas sp. CFBP 13724]
MKNASSQNPVSPYCTGCGACIADSDQTLRMDWDVHGFLVPHKISDRPVPELAIKACPFAAAAVGGATDEDKLAEDLFPDAPTSDPEIGRFEQTYIGYSPSHRETSSSGGLATFVFDEVLTQGIATHLFVVLTDGAGYKYRLVEGNADLVTTSKTRYFPVTLQEFFELVPTLDGRIAVSGVACFVKAVRMRQRSFPEFDRKIAFVVGIICGGLKSKYFTDYLADSAGAGARYRHPEYRVKDATASASNYAFSAEGEDGTVHTMKMARVGDMWGTGMFKAKACDFCTDVLTELADISLGDAWLPEYRTDGLGNSVIVTRSRLADDIIRRGIEQGNLHVASCAPSQITSSQRASFLHRRDALKFRIGQARIQGQPVPEVRSRVLKRISFSYALVQIQRELTRSASFTSWRRSRSANGFDRTMRPYRILLKIVTRLNRMLR